ncbi:hypothetical protein [Methylomonas sp. MgM2]
MTTQIQAFFDIDSKEFVEALSQNILETQQEIRAEISTFTENDKEKIKIIESLYKSIFSDAVSSHEKRGGEFSNHIQKSEKKAIKKGFSIKEIRLSRLVYVSGLATGYFCESKIYEAIRMLSITNKYLGEYQGVIGWNSIFNYKPGSSCQNSFRRDTLIKLIFGMSKSAYKCSIKDIDKYSKMLFHSLSNNKIYCPIEKIKQYLVEAHGAKSLIENNEYNNAEIVPNEDKNDMLLIILGIAIDKFDYDLNKKSNKATGENSEVSM